MECNWVTLDCFSFSTVLTALALQGEPPGSRENCEPSVKNRGGREPLLSKGWLLKFSFFVVWNVCPHPFLLWWKYQEISTLGSPWPSSLRSPLLSVNSNSPYFSTSYSFLRHFGTSSSHCPQEEGSFLLNSLGAFAENQFKIDVWVYSGTLNSIPLIYKSSLCLCHSILITVAL